MIKIISTSGFGNELFYLNLYLNLSKMGYSVTLYTDKSRYKLNDYMVIDCIKLEDSHKFKTLLNKLGVNRKMIFLFERMNAFFSIINYPLQIIDNIIKLKLTKIFGTTLMSGTFHEIELFKNYLTLKSIPFSKHKNYKLKGYWQRGDLLSNDNLEGIKFLLENKQSRNYSDYLSVIKNDLAIHIRGGDFLKFNTHNFVNSNYYDLALTEMSKYISIDNANIIVFTNDKTHAENILKNIKIKIKYSYSELESSLDDFMFLREFKYMILSNSTYSWWAARLSNYNDKVVIRPTPLAIGFKDFLKDDGYIHITKSSFIQ
jgi:hypothetical protein